MFTHRKLNNPSVMIALFVSLASMLIVDAARAGFWFEDFTDENISDSGIDWTLASHTNSSDGLELNSDDGVGGFARAELPVFGQSWSVRTKARLLGDLGVLGAGAGDTWGGVGVNGDAWLGKGGQILTDAIETNLRPGEEDVTIQFDTFNSVLRMWAWHGEAPPAQGIEPLVEIEVIQPDGVPSLWTNSLIHPTAAAHFSWIAISTEHMPVNMDVPLSDLIGDFSGDDILDITDIDLLATAVREGTVHPQYDLDQNGIADLGDHTYWVTDIRQTWIGDANLDGEFNSSDFVEVFQTGKYETGEAAGWSQGDWNADGVFDSSDFVSAFQGGGYESGARAAVLAVPEPSAAILLALGLLGMTRTRKR